MPTFMIIRKSNIREHEMMIDSDDFHEAAQFGLRLADEEGSRLADIEICEDMEFLPLATSAQASGTSSSVEDIDAQSEPQCSGAGVMVEEEIDDALRASGVRFLPWVGAAYRDGFLGRRFLILGESHYDEWRGERNELTECMTRTCVTEAIDRVEGSPFWKNLEQVLLNEERINGWAPSGGNLLWNRVAVYNFVQAAIRGGPRVRPSWEAFEASQKPFRAVLEALRPERVLVCGKGLWETMEEISEHRDLLHDNLQAYRLSDGTQVWCLATVHPCSGRYSWRRLHTLITAFINDPRSTAEMLGPKSW